MKKLLGFAILPALVVVHLLGAPLVAGPPARDAAENRPSSPGTAKAGTEKSRALPVPNPNLEEDRVFHTLGSPTQIDFRDLPLPDALQFLEAYHAIPIHIDDTALKAAKIEVNTPVTLKRFPASFQRILNLLVEPLGLDWYVAGAEIVVTTRTAAAAAVHKRLEKLLEPELQIIDYLCELTDAQREKLQIAARGDFRRVSDGIAERARKLPLPANDERKADDLCSEIEQIQREIRLGPFGKGSLFRKALETTLTAGQMAKYDPIRAVVQARGQVGTLQRGPDVILGVHLLYATFSDDDLARLKGFTVLAFLQITGTEITDTGLASLKDLANLRELYLGDTRITDVGLAHLKELKNLQVLNLGATTAVSDAGLVHLKGLTKLQELNLAATQVTGAGLAHLRGLTKLQVLDLYKTQVADAGLEHLAELTDLRRLVLADSQVTGAGLAHVKGLVNLQELNLRRTPVADDGLSHLSQLMDLRVLFLNRTQISDTGLAQLNALANLRELHIGETQVTDAGLAHLKGLTALQRLDLSATKVTDAGIATLKTALPNVEITK